MDKPCGMRETPSQPPAVHDALTEAPDPRADAIPTADPTQPSGDRNRVRGPLKTTQLSAANTQNHERTIPRCFKPLACFGGRRDTHLAHTSRNPDISLDLEKLEDVLRLHGQSVPSTQTTRRAVEPASSPGPGCFRLLHTSRVAVHNRRPLQALSSGEGSMSPRPPLLL